MANPEIIESQQLEIYHPFMQQLADFKEEESRLVFDYEDKQGNKDARSHVYKLRKSKTAIDSARKEAKSEHLETGRKIDAQAKSITAEIQEMIDVHQDKLDAIEQREADRIAAIEQRMVDLEAPILTALFSSDPDVNLIDELKKRLARIKAVNIDDSFEEFANKAATIKDQSVTTLEKQIAVREKAEADAAELAKLREEQNARDKADREAKLKADAKAEAERESAEREKRLKEKAAADKKAAKEKAEREKKEAADKAAKAEADLKLQKERAKKQRAEAEKREAELKAENERLEREAEERDKKTKAVQTAIADLKKSIDIASGQSEKFIELKLTTAKTLLSKLEK